MYDNEFETKEKKYEPRVKLKHNTNNKFEFLDGGI